MTSAIVYVPPKGVILFPSDVVEFEDDPERLWLVVSVRPGAVFMELLGPPTDAEIWEWIA